MLCVSPSRKNNHWNKPASWTHLMENLSTFGKNIYFSFRPSKIVSLAFDESEVMK